VTVAGTAILIGVRHFKWRFTKCVILFAVAFSLLWMITFLTTSATRAYKLLSAEHYGRCEVIEGVVTDFRPAPYDGHRDESFVVGNVRFAYSDYDAGPGFHRTRSHGGPINEGSHVRIYHVGNEIARLDIAN
jgi:hypothetical protein